MVLFQAFSKLFRGNLCFYFFVPLLKTSECKAKRELMSDASTSHSPNFEKNMISLASSIFFQIEQAYFLDDIPEL